MHYGHYPPNIIPRLVSRWANLVSPPRYNLHFRRQNLMGHIDIPTYMYFTVVCVNTFHWTIPTTKRYLGHEKTIASMIKLTNAPIQPLAQTISKEYFRIWPATM